MKTADTHVLQENITSTIEVTIQLETARRTTKALVATKLVVQLATTATALAGVLLGNQMNHHAVLFGLVENALPEVTMGPRKYLANGQASNLAAILANHLTHAKLRQQDDIVVLAQIQGNLLVDILGQVVDVTVQPLESPPHVVALPASLPAFSLVSHNPGLQLACLT